MITVGGVGSQPALNAGPTVIPHLMKAIDPHNIGKTEFLEILQSV
jgi:hypothetical protein